jgi:hypothetical protein
MSSSSSKRAAVLSTVATVASLVCSSAATAGEAFTLTSYQLDKVTAAGTVNFNTQVTKNVTITKNVNLTVNKNVTSTVNVTGNLATAEASADSVGFANNLAETDTFAQVQPGGAFSFSESLAAGTGTLAGN